MDPTNFPLSSKILFSRIDERRPSILSYSPIDSIYLRETSCSPPPKKQGTNISDLSQRCLSVEKNYHKNSKSVDYRSTCSPNLKKDNSKGYKIRLLKAFTISPKKRKKNTYKVTAKEIEDKRTIRCKAINSLLSVCNNFESAKGVNNTIAKEKVVIQAWSKAVDKVTENLLKINDTNPDIVHHLYYFNKFSNEEICKDISQLMAKKALPSVYSVKLNHTNRRKSSGYNKD